MAQASRQWDDGLDWNYGASEDQWREFVHIAPEHRTELHPHRDVHARGRSRSRADELGFDYAWLAEHHFSNEYGIMPMCSSTWLSAALTGIKIGTAVVTLLLANPRALPNTAFVYILSNGDPSRSWPGYRNTNSKGLERILTDGATCRKKRCRC